MPERNGKRDYGSILSILIIACHTIIMIVSLAEKTVSNFSIRNLRKLVEKAKQQGMHTLRDTTIHMLMLDGQKSLQDTIKVLSSDWNAYVDRVTKRNGTFMPDVQAVLVQELISFLHVTDKERMVEFLVEEAYKQITHDFLFDVAILMGVNVHMPSVRKRITFEEESLNLFRNRVMFVLNPTDFAIETYLRENICVCAEHMPMLVNDIRLSGSPDKYVALYRIAYKASRKYTPDDFTHVTPNEDLQHHLAGYFSLYPPEGNTLWQINEIIRRECVLALTIRTPITWEGGAWEGGVAEGAVIEGGA